MDCDAIATRSRERVLRRLSDDAPCRDDDALVCPFCGRALAVRRTILGRLEELADGRRPHIDGVQMKCAGGGCGFRPDFDVPVIEGRGYWPDLSAEAEWQRERELRDGERSADMGYTPDEGAGLEARLRALGYLR